MPRERKSIIASRRAGQRVSTLFTEVSSFGDVRLHEGLVPRMEVDLRRHRRHLPGCWKKLAAVPELGKLGAPTKSHGTHCQYIS